MKREIPSAKHCLMPKRYGFQLLDVVHRPFYIRYAKACTITGPAIAVAGPASSGVRLCSIHASTRLFDSAAPA